MLGSLHQVMFNPGRDASQIGASGWQLRASSDFSVSGRRLELEPSAQHSERRRREPAWSQGHDLVLLATVGADEHLVRPGREA